MSESGSQSGDTNRFSRLTGCRVPIQLASMGGVVTPELAGAVAAAGGLGMLAAPMVTADDLTRQIEEAERLAGHSGRIGVGFLMPFLDRAAFEAATERSVVIECFYGEPDPSLIEVAHDGDALAAWQAGSVEEARAAVDAGCDFVVVQGVEAGGHVHGDQPLDRLLAQVRALTDLPVVAAGGIGTADRAAELIDAGADGVRIGTRFLATAEANVHPEYTNALIGAVAEDTVVTETFSMAWPHAPHRVLRSCIEASTAPPDQRLPVPPGRDFVGDVSAAALYAGRSVGEVTTLTSAAAVMAEFSAALEPPR